MSGNVEKRLLIVALALVGVTLISWWIGSHHGQRQFASNILITYSVVLIAAIKARVVIREFMEVRHAPVLLRRLTDGWIIFIAVALLAIYSLKISMPPV
jgi:hypothetical protein